MEDDCVVPREPSGLEKAIAEWSDRKKMMDESNARQDYLQKQLLKERNDLSQLVARETAAWEKVVELRGGSAK